MWESVLVCLWYTILLQRFLRQTTPSTSRPTARSHPAHSTQPLESSCTQPRHTPHAPRRTSSMISSKSAPKALPPPRPLPRPLLGLPRPLQGKRVQGVQGCKGSSLSLVVHPTQPPQPPLPCTWQGGRKPGWCLTHARSSRTDLQPRLCTRRGEVPAQAGTPPPAAAPPPTTSGNATTPLPPNNQPGIVCTSRACTCLCHLLRPCCLAAVPLPVLSCPCPPPHLTHALIHLHLSLVHDS